MLANKREPSISQIPAKHEGSVKKKEEYLTPKRMTSLFQN